jgi:hypothetical protein
MRFSRFLLLAVVVLCTLAPSAFACRFCNDIDFPPSCDFAPPPTDGCKFTQDGCTSGTHCNAALPDTKPVVLWSVASIEVTHQQSPAVTSRENAKPVVASKTPLSRALTR